jgi:uncharacterized membrane protein YqgA involved in biofilm formation
VGGIERDHFRLQRLGACENRCQRVGNRHQGHGETPEGVTEPAVLVVIASHRIGAKRRPMTGSAKQSIFKEKLDCFVASLLAMTASFII